MRNIFIYIINFILINLRSCLTISFVLIFLFSSIENAVAQKQKTQLNTNILFLFDASQSMYARWETDTKYDIATRLLSELVDSLQQFDHVKLALRVYGHTKRYPPQDCDDTRLEVPFGSQNGYRIKKRLKEITPSGTTPIARSLDACQSDFPQEPGRNIIILITDGIEECNGDPCAVSLQLQKKGIVLKPFVIGLGVNKEFLRQFECIGNYFDAANEIGFKKVLNVVITQALNNTTAQVNLLDISKKATETNVNMTFYDRHTGAIRYNFVHTINAMGLPDTLQIDPLGIYRIVVHTIPPVTKDSISLTPGKHNIIGIETPQGDLSLKVDGSNEYRKLNCIIRKHDDMNTINVQELNSSERYLVGKYDLEFLTLPRIYLPDVDIAQSKTTTVQIPTPGLATLIANSPGYGSVYLEKDNKLELIYTMSQNTVKENLVLQPGSYRVVFRPRNSQMSIYTVEKGFTVTSGNSTSVIIN